MIENRPVNPVSGVLMVALALVLYVIPVPGANALRLDFVALLVLYLGIYREQPYPLLGAFAAGMLQDLVSLAPLGQHALGLLLVSAILQSMRDRLRLINPARQLPAVLALLLLLKLQYSWIAALNFGTLPTLDALGSSLLTAAAWIPLVWVVQWLETRRFA